MFHFGINIKKAKADCYLTRENYALIDDNTVSTVAFIDWLLHEKFYLLYPIDIASKYLERVIIFYAKQNSLTAKQEERYFKACIALDEINRVKSKSGENGNTSIELQFEDELFQMNKERYTRDILIGIYNRYDFEKCIEGKIYSEQYCRLLYKNAMENFDLNIRYFNQCSKQEFEKALENFIYRNPKFVEVIDLNEYAYKSGYYLMVLDVYNQVYIGTTNNIKQRVMQHWQKRKHLDRLVFPNGAVDSSVVSIDSFKHLDTTRLFVYTTSKTYISEDKFINDFGKMFVLNRIAGGKMSLGALQKLFFANKRNL